MLLKNITHKTSLSAIKKHNITEEQLESMQTVSELKLFIQRASRRLWYKNNKQYFKDKYVNEYRDQVANKYYLNNCLPCV